MPYRVESASTGRAGCKMTECNKNKDKILKGELRFGTLITIQDHMSWTWKHWGCVTPQQVANLQEESGKDTDMIDGYDELPAEYQHKVKYALDNGHVEDADWKWDIECNRVGTKGFRVKAPPKKKGKKTAEDDMDETEVPEPKKKRGRAAKEEDEEEAPVPKKTRGRPKKDVVTEDPRTESNVEQPKAKKTARGKKAAVKKAASEDEDDGAELPTPEAKKTTRGRKVKKEASEDEGDEQAEAPKPKRGRKKVVEAEAEEQAAVPKKVGRKKKVAAEDD